MKRKWQRHPFFLLLLPVFFVFHGFVENCYFIRFTDCIPLMGIYAGLALLLYFAGWWLLKDKVRAALFASFFMGFYLFFGAFHDFLRLHAIFLHRYSILLPGFILLSILFGVYLKKTGTSFLRVTLFLNSLLVLYILFDGAVWAWKTVKREPAGFISSPLLTGRCDTCSRPDIYLLVFDEYSAGRTLRDVYHYDNGGLDSFLKDEGFHIQQKSRSNYYITPFSIASLLNFSYIRDLPHPLKLEPEDLLNVLEPIQKNEVVNFLLSQGYDIVNNSPFDLPEHPSRIDQPFIPVKTKLITRRTLTDYLIRDLGEWFTAHLDKAPVPSSINRVGRMNDSFLLRTAEESGRRSVSPRFVYMHVMMPHWPALYDSSFHRRSVEDIIRSGDIPKNYLGYLPYVNSRIRELITAIRKNTGGRAVILFMSDHGYRYDPHGYNRPDLFYNQNAVYFPDGDYSLFYDSISNVNQFRVVFRKLFRQNLPLLKDSVIYLETATWGTQRLINE
jgi:hypothetical protein